MMEEPQRSTVEEQKSNINPLLIVVILIIIAAVGVMFWLGNSKNELPDAQSATPTVRSETNQATEGDTAKGEQNDTQSISIEGGNFYFEPNEIKVKKGEPVSITFSSQEGMHNFVIDEFAVVADTIDAGKTTTVTFTPDQIGEFEFYCSVGNHRQLGMKGTLIVE